MDIQEYCALLRIIVLIAVMHRTESTCGDVVSDPCCLENNKELPYQFSRHPSIPLSYTTEATKYCDLYALRMNQWYRSDFSLTQTCVNHGVCGTSDPVWLNGTMPEYADDVVIRKACVRTLFNCCEIELSVKVKNCIWYMVYNFQNLYPSCHSRFCLDIDLSKVTTTTASHSSKNTPESSTKDNVTPGKNRTTKDTVESNVEVVVLAVALSIAVLTVTGMAVVIYQLRSRKITASTASLSSSSPVHVHIK